MRFGVVVFLSIGVALVAPAPWLLGWVEARPDAPPLVAHLFARYSAAQLVFLAHVAGGGVALLIGPWQLARRRPHRAVGYAYVVAVAIAGTAGLVMAVRAWGGPVAQVGFTALAIAWLGATALGLQRILSGDRTGHRAWMVTSFALTFAAVSLRLQMLIYGVAGVPGEISYAIVAWSSWVPNLAVAYVLVRRNSAGAAPVHLRNARVNELCSENPSR